MERSSIATTNEKLDGSVFLYCSYNRIAVSGTEQVSQQAGIISMRSLLPHNEK